MNSEQQKNSSHILIMNNDIKTIDNLSHTKALRYIDRKIYEYTSKKSWDTINKSFYIDSIKQLSQKRKEINKNIAKLEKTNNLLNNIFDENKQLKQELRGEKKKRKQQKQELTYLVKQKKEISKQLQEEIKINKYKNKLLKKDLKEQKKDLQKKIKEHPVFLKNRDKAKAFKMFRSLNFEIKSLETAYKGTVGKYACRKKVKRNQDYSIKCETGTQIEIILDKTIEARAKFYCDTLKKEKGLKIKEEIQCVFKKYNNEINEYQYITIYLGSSKTTYTFINNGDVLEKLKKSSEIFGRLVDEYNGMGSGSIIDAFIQVIIHKALYSPLSGSTYIKLPDYLENKQACINVNNKDNDCFRYSVCAHIYPPKKNQQRVKTILKIY